MYLCSEDHVEICHARFVCPLCEIRTELEQEIESLKEEIDRLQQTLNETKGRT